MKLTELLESVRVTGVSGSPAVEIEGLAYDSRQVKPGWMFVAVPGANFDGVEFVADALSAGAVAVVSETELDLGKDAVHVQVPHARRALAELANAFYGDLTRQMTMVGITGTNGKTTTSYMVRNMLRDSGMLPGLLGTVAYEIGDHSIPASRTTPEAQDIHSMLSRMHEAGCDSAVMEVSSHALSLDRVHGIDFNVGVFTNLTHDHLDYHKDMEDYFQAKAHLFSKARHGKHAVAINIDDEWGRRLIEESDLPDTVVTYGFNDGADVRASHAVLNEKGTQFKVTTPWGKAKVKLELLGRFNIHNAMAAIAAGGLCGIGLDRMVESLRVMEPVPGRLELVKNRRRKKIFVDYAHTEDALANVLDTLREICKGRLICVFGCGGDRDRAKREKMGQVAAEKADYSIITSDNPRGEEPAAIVAEIMKGFDDASKFEVVLDRREAIEKAIGMTGRKDVLLVAGKGHETYQELHETVIPFDDRETVREYAG